MGRDLLLPRRAGRHPRRRLGDRPARESGSRCRRAGERLPPLAASRSAGRPVRRGPGRQQSRDPALLLVGAPLRADVGRRAPVDVARAGPPGDRPRRAVPEFHLRLRDGGRDRAAAAPRVPHVHVRRPAQPLPRERVGRNADSAAAPRRARLVRLFRRGAAQRSGDDATRRRSAGGRRRRVGARLPNARRHARREGGGLFHRTAGAHRAHRRRGRRGGRQRRPHRLRRRVRRDRGRVAACGRAAGSGVAGGYADGRPQPELPRRDRIAGSPARQADDGVTRLVEVPAQFDDRSFDQFAGAFAEANKDAERLLFDAHAAEWASPYGLVGLLAAGQAARRGGSAGAADRPLLTAPTNPEVLSYWTRAGVFREAAELFEIHGKVPRAKAAEHSDGLLPVAPVGGGRRRRGLPALARADSEQAVRRPLGRRGGAGSGAGARREPVSRSRARPGARGDPALSRPLGRQDRDPERHGAHRDRAEVGRGCSAEGRPAALSGRPGSHHHPGAGVHRAVIQYIDMHAVLQQSVSSIYTDLVTRPTGRVVRERIEQAIAGLGGAEGAEGAGGAGGAGGPDGAGEMTIARIDFAGVGCIDYSCADEIVAKLRRDRPALLVLSGISEGHREAIEPVLTGHGLAALIERADGTLDVLGAKGAAAALLDELVARRCAARRPGGTYALTLA